MINALVPFPNAIGAKGFPATFLADKSNIATLWSSDMSDAASSLPSLLNVTCLMPLIRGEEIRYNSYIVLQFQTQRNGFGPI